MRAVAALLLCWVLAAGACPLCPDGAQGPHDCCHRSQTTPCGHPQTPQPDKQQPCPGGHPLFAGYGKAQTDSGILAAASANAGPLPPAEMSPARMPEVVLNPVLDPGHTPPPLFLLNSILRI
jgi:hypothetical protein